MSTNVDLSSVTYSQILKYFFEKFSNSFVGDVSKTVTFRDFNVLSNDISLQMENNILSPKEVVHFIGPNSLALCACYCGVVYNDWIPVGSSSTTPLLELQNNINNTYSKALVISKDLWETFGPKLTSKTLKLVFVYDVVEKDSFAIDIQKLEFDNTGENVEYDKSQLEKVSFMFMTSGSTGHPKAVMINHSKVLEALVLLSKSFEAQSVKCQKTFIFCNPFSNAGGMLTFFIGILNGHNIITIEGFDSNVYLDTFKRYKCNYILCTPAMLISLSKYSKLSDYDFSNTCTIVCGGAKLNIEAIKVIKDRTNLPDEVEFFEVYGSSECTTSHFTKSDINDIKEYHDPPAPPIQCKIMNVDTLMECKTDEDGELWIKSPSTMLGYLSDEAKTKSVLTDDGWYRTGDVAHFDHAGKLYLSGRIKEVIKFRAFSVHSVEIERVLLQHSAVKLAGVIGEHHEEHGEIPVAVIEKASHVTAEEIIQFVNERVSEYKRLHKVYFMDQIPFNSGNKVDKKMLKEFIKCK